MMPLVRVVLPAPSSPESSTTTGGVSCAANSLPFSIVSSAERVMNSLRATVELRPNLPERLRYGCEQIGGDHGRLAPARRGLLRYLEAIGLHLLCRAPEEPGHLARMRGQGERRRLALLQLVGAPGKGVQAVGIEDRRQRALGQHCAHKLLRFAVGRKTRTDGNNILALD